MHVCHVLSALEVRKQRGQQQAGGGPASQPQLPQVHTLSVPARDEVRTTEAVHQRRRRMAPAVVHAQEHSHRITSPGECLSGMHHGHSCVHSLGLHYDDVLFIGTRFSNLYTAVHPVFISVSCTQHMPVPCTTPPLSTQHRNRTANTQGAGRREHIVAQLSTFSARRAARSCPQHTAHSTHNSTVLSGTMLLARDRGDDGAHPAAVDAIPACPCTP